MTFTLTLEVEDPFALTSILFHNGLTKVWVGVPHPSGRYHEWNSCGLSRDPQTAVNLAVKAGKEARDAHRAPTLTDRIRDLNINL